MRTKYFPRYLFRWHRNARSILCDGDIVWVLLKNDTLLKFQDNEFEAIDLSPAITGINESITDTTKAYISDGVLYIESNEDITNINIYDSMGRKILTLNPSPVERGVQVALPNVKGVLIVKVNSEVIKVIK